MRPRTCFPLLTSILRLLGCVCLAAGVFRPWRGFPGHRAACIYSYVCVWKVQENNPEWLEKRQKTSAHGGETRSLERGSSCAGQRGRDGPACGTQASAVARGPVAQRLVGVKVHGIGV